MKNDEHLERHFELCERVYLELVAAKKWPWRDSRESKSHGRFEETNTDS